MEEMEDSDVLLDEHTEGSGLPHPPVPTGRPCEYCGEWDGWHAADCGQQQTLDGEVSDAP